MSRLGFYDTIFNSRHFWGGGGTVLLTGNLAMSGNLQKFVAQFRSMCRTLSRRVLNVTES